MSWGGYIPGHLVSRDGGPIKVKERTTVPFKSPQEYFGDRANVGAYWEAWVGAVLAGAGLYTLHVPFDTKEDKDLTEPDLIVARDPYEFKYSAYPIEIKSLSLTFYNTLTYPFEDVLICAQNSFIRKWPGRDYICRDFLLVSRPTGAIVWIPAMTKVTFGKEVHDKFRGETYKAVHCSRDQLRPLADFVEMVKDG